MKPEVVALSDGVELSDPSPGFNYKWKVLHNPHKDTPLEIESPNRREVLVKSDRMKAGHYAFLFTVSYRLHTSECVSIIIVEDRPLEALIVDVKWFPEMLERECVELSPEYQSYCNHFQILLKGPQESLPGQGIYYWDQINEGPGLLRHKNSMNAMFLPIAPGRFEFQLIVGNSIGNSTPIRVSIYLWVIITKDNYYDYGVYPLNNVTYYLNETWYMSYFMYLFS